MNFKCRKEQQCRNTVSRQTNEDHEKNSSGKLSLWRFRKYLPQPFFQQGNEISDHTDRMVQKGGISKQQVQSIAAGYGITTDIDWDDFQNPLVSDMELSKIVADNVRDYAQLEPIHTSMAGEDFCDFMPVTMPVFAFIGSNGEKDCPDWHSPHFVGLDESLQAGVEFYANAALTVLNELS